MQRQNEDLFESSKMTFGEHLEELRVALWKSVVALMIGTVFGLYFASSVVQFLQVPLKTALEDYYAERTAERLLEEINEMKEQGVELPPLLNQIDGPSEDGEEKSEKEKLAAAEKYLKDIDMLPEPVYLEAPEIFRELKRRYPDVVKGDNLPDSTGEINKQQMLRVFVWRPQADDIRTRVKGLTAQEGFMIWLKAGLATGLVFASPLIFWYLWNFVAAGLYPHEKSYIHVFLPFSIVLFIAGAAMAFFVVFRFVLNFLFMYYGMLDVDPDPRINYWLSFALFLPVGFGISFQLPLVMLFLERIGIFSVKAYVSNWRIAILAIAVISMLLTPADPQSMLLMAIPLVVLYFGGVLLCRYLPRRKSPFDDPLD